jgi:hypothetical protein
MADQIERELRQEMEREMNNQPIATIEDYLAVARDWSDKTFGHGRRTLGICQHITKELKEIQADPLDLEEWVDVVILALDGFGRAGGRPNQLLPMMAMKLAKNMARNWPPPGPEDQAIEHIRDDADPLNPELGPQHREYWVRMAERRLTK